MTSIHFAVDDSGNRVGVPAGPVEARRPDDSTLVGSRVRLERLRQSHSPDLWDAFAATPSTTLWTYMPQGPFASEEHLREWVESVATSTDPLFYAIIDASTSRAVGVASYLRIDETNGVIEVGYLSFSSALSRSVAATEAMYLMARNAFARGFRRYEWKCNVLNGPSVAAAERLGFSFEGVFRNAVVVKGRNRDTAWFSITVDDWSNGLQDAHEQWLDESNFTDSGEQITRLSELTRPFLASRFPTVTVDFEAAPAP